MWDGKGLALHYHLLEPHVADCGFLCCWGWGGVGGGAQDEGDTEAGLSTSFLLERLPGPMPTPSSPSRPQHTPRDQGAELAHPGNPESIPGLHWEIWGFLSDIAHGSLRGWDIVWGPG